MDLQPDAAAVRRQMEHILASRVFVRSVRMCRFLRVIVEESLDSQTPCLKESLLAVRVFDRDAGFDPAVDPVVRVEARRLRSKLEDYYRAEGASDPVRIGIPVGSYAPTFEFAPAPHAVTVAPGPAPRSGLFRQAKAAIAVGAALCTILVTVSWFLLSQTKAIQSIAVLPFLDLSPEKNQGHLCDGLADQIMSVLSQVDGLYVPGRTSSFGFRESTASLREIGAALHVDHLLEGSLQTSGKRLRITARLIAVKTGAQRWSQTYDREVDDIFALEDEITRAVTNALRIRIAPEAHERAKAGMTENSSALQLYLQGREFWYRNDFNRSASFFQEALRRDPGFARAYTGLARAYVRLEEEPDALAKAEQNARRALEIDETLAEAVMVLAIVRTRQWDWQGARSEFQRALKLDPMLAEAHGEFAIGYLAPSGEIAGALRESAVSLRLEPSAPFENIRHGVLLTYARRYSDAESQLRKAMIQAPRYAARHLGKLYLVEGRYDDALPLLEGEPVWQAIALARAGRRAQASSLATERLATDQSDAFLALYWDAMGDRDRAFAILEQACYSKAMALTTLANPVWDPLRTDSRLDALLSRMGLPGKTHTTSTE